MLLQFASVLVSVMRVIESDRHFVRSQAEHTSEIIVTPSSLAITPSNACSFDRHRRSTRPACTAHSRSWPMAVMRLSSKRFGAFLTRYGVELRTFLCQKLCSGTFRLRRRSSWMRGTALRTYSAWKPAKQCVLFVPLCCSILSLQQTLECSRRQ
jgi:hypothetical protein